MENRGALRILESSAYPVNLIGKVNFRIWDKLKKYGIEIPYPQRNLYIKEWPDGNAPEA